MQTVTPTRPQRRDPEIIQIAAAKLAAVIVKEWIDDGTPVEDVAKDLERAMRWDDDGYAIAKKLDGYYDPDARLVDLLDQAGHLIRVAHDEACREWVKTVGAEPPAVGARVTCEAPRCAGVGEIVVNHPDGRSTVCFPDAGHVKQGSGTHGFVLEWEKLTILSENT